MAALDVAQRVSQRHLAADLAGEHQLGLGEAEVRRDHLAVDRVDRARLAREHLAEGRLGVGVGVEVVAEVSLRVGVDGQDARARPARRRRPASGSSVVFPVPPFCDRTAIVTDMRRDYNRRSSIPVARPLEEGAETGRSE